VLQALGHALLHGLGALDLEAQVDESRTGGVQRRERLVALEPRRRSLGAFAREQRALVAEEAFEVGDEALALGALDLLLLAPQLLVALAQLRLERRQRLLEAQPLGAQVLERDRGGGGAGASWGRVYSGRGALFKAEDAR